MSRFWKRYLTCLTAMILASLFLAGCAADALDCSMGIWHDDCAPDTLAYQQREEAQARSQAAAAAMAANDDAKCQSYGLQPGSEGYAQCRMNLDNQRAQMAAALAPRVFIPLPALPAAPMMPPPPRL